MPKVIVSGARLQMPVMCVCCGGTPDRELRDAGYHRTRKGRDYGGDKAIEFPVCAGCLRHREQELGLFGGLLAGAIVRSPTCEGVGRLVDYVEWKGTEHTIRFDSPRFARAFAEANRAAGKSVLRLDLEGAPRVNNPPPPYAPGAQAPPSWAPPPAPAFAPAPKAPASPAVVLLAAIGGLGFVCCIASMATGSRAPSQGTLAPPSFRASPEATSAPRVAPAAAHDAGHRSRRHHREAK